MKSIRLVFPVAIALLVTALLLSGWLGYHYPMSVIGYPLCLGLLAIFTALIVMVTEIAQPAASPDAGAAHADSHARIAQENEAAILGGAGAWLQLACLLVLMVLGWVLGFVPGIVIFVFGYLWRAGWSWPRALLYGCAAGLTVWVLFDLVFFTPLPFWPVFMR
jgi:hypothetical protein